MSSNDENETLREERDDLRKRLEGIKRIPRYGTKWSVRDFHDGSSEVLTENWMKRGPTFAERVLLGDPNARAEMVQALKILTKKAPCEESVSDRLICTTGPSTPESDD